MCIWIICKHSSRLHLEDSFFWGSRVLLSCRLPTNGDQGKNPDDILHIHNLPCTAYNHFLPRPTIIQGVAFISLIDVCPPNVHAQSSDHRGICSWWVSNPDRHLFSQANNQQLNNIHIKKDIKRIEYESSKKKPSTISLTIFKVRSDKRREGGGLFHQNQTTSPVPLFNSLFCCWQCILTLIGK